MVVKTFFLDKEEIEALRVSTIGVTCSNLCKGAGVILSQTSFIDCACQKDFQNKIKYIASNIPKKYWDFTLRNLTKEFVEGNKAGLGILQEYREKIDIMVKEGIGLYIQGSSGLAKSALSYHLLKYAASKNIICYGIRMSQLTKLIFDSLKDDKFSDLLDYIKKDVQLLLIDEIEKDYNISDLNKFSGVQVNDFFGSLYDRKKSLITTSNIPKGGLKNIHASNIVDRLEELIDIIFTGSSYRKSDGALKKLFE